MKKVLNVVIVLVVLIVLGNIIPDSKPEKTEAQSVETLENEATSAENKSEVAKPVEEPKVTLTSGQKNALEKAADYLNYTAFSKKGLMDQLEYEGFTHSDALYAADNIDTDWNEQAYLKAVDYLEYSAFSRDGLIEQLEYEGFTHSEAVYGTDKAY